MNPLTSVPSQQPRAVLRSLVLLLALGPVALGAACSKEPTPPGEQPTDTKPEKGVVKGHVTDTQGKALAGAKIVVNNTVFYNSNIVVSSDASGNYSYKMPATDSWYVRGTIDRQYNGRSYTLDLHPDVPGPFTGAEGAVINLQWKLSGALPTDFGTSGYYGGSVVVNNYTFDDIDMANVELTLTPSGPLIDGSQGQPITQKLIKRNDGWVIQDVPIGRYTLTAKATATGDTLKLQLPTDQGPAQTSMTADFEPSYDGATVYRIPVSVSLQ